MKVWTVTQIHEAIDVTPFSHSYRSKHDAVRAVEADAVEQFEGDIDPNDGGVHQFPGLVWDDAFESASLEDSELEYIITETELQ